MNKSILIICCLLLSYSKAIHSQEVEKISIQFADQTLLSALHELEQVSAFRFVFQDIDPELEVASELEFEQVSTFQILNTLLADTGFDFVGFHRNIETFWVVVYKTNISNETVEPELISVAGKIYDPWGPVAFAILFEIPERQSVDSNNSVVIVDNNNRITRADMDGNFFIPSVDKNAFILVRACDASFPRVVRVKDAELIQLEPNEDVLNQVITIRREPQ